MAPEREIPQETILILVPRCRVVEDHRRWSGDGKWLRQRDCAFELRWRIVKRLQSNKRVSLSVQKENDGGHLAVFFDFEPVDLVPGLDQPDLHFAVSHFVPTCQTTDDVTGEVTSDMGSVMGALLGGQSIELRVSDKETPEIVRSK